MNSRSEELASYVSLSPEGLTTLAGVLDQSIQESIRQRKERGSRENAGVLHGLIREGVILAEEKSNHLKAQGISLTTGASDGITVHIKGALTPLKLTHRPKMSRPAEPFLDIYGDMERAIFPAPIGHLRLFYSLEGGRLKRLTLTKTLTNPDDYYRDCQILDEISIPILVQLAKPAAPYETRNDADDLSGLIRTKNQTRLTEESNTDAETGRGAANTA